MEPPRQDEAARGRVGRGSVRQRLLLTLTLALSPILILAALRSISEVSAGDQNRKEEIQLLSTDVVNDMEQELARAETLLRLFKDDVRGKNCQQVYDRVKPGLRVLFAVTEFDTKGDGRCSTVKADRIRMTNLDWNQRLADGEAVVMTDAFPGQAVQGWFYAFMARLEDAQGRFNGSVSFAVQVEDVATLVRAYRLPKGVEVALSDTRGGVFRSSRFKTIDPNWIRKVRTSGAPQLFTTPGGPDGPLDVVIAEMRPNRAFAVISRPSPGFLSEFTLAPLSSFGLPLIAFTIALISAWIAIDRLVLDWLVRLQRRAAAYGAGHLATRDIRTAQESPRELAELATAMDQMADAIGRRNASLKQALHEREMAVREIHHRVKNNLQIVTSYLNLQRRQIEDDEGRLALDAARIRIEALSVVHQTLYQHEQLDRVETRPFFDNLLTQLANALGLDGLGVILMWDVENMLLKADDAIPVALFTVEAVTNSVKYAFPKRAGRITVALASTDGGARLVIADDGVGVASQPGRTDGGGLGGRLMAAFARQLRGDMKIEAQPGAGYRVSLVIPVQPPSPAVDESEVAA